MKNDKKVSFDCFWKSNPITNVPIIRGPITIGRMNLMSNIIYIKIKGVEGELIHDIYYKKSSFNGNVRNKTKKQFLDILNGIFANDSTIEKSKSW